MRLRDVARVELGALDYTTNSFFLRKPAVALLVSQLPGANALETAKAIEQRMVKLGESSPQGLIYTIGYNPSEFIAESIHELNKTIYEAMILVVIVVIVFLQGWRPSIIPILAIPVSLIGTFAVLSALGFSLNNLTLFGLVLAVGIVVDDAIVVVENVERHLAAGETKRTAALRTMREVGGALVSIALVLCAVFVPTAFLGGIAGQFFRQFAITIAVATVLSCFCSLTLSPALSSLLLKEHAEKRAAKRNILLRGLDRLCGGFNAVFDRMSRGYGSLARFVIRFSPVMFAIYLLLIGSAGWLLYSTSQGFIPAQDRGYLIVAVQLPSGAALSRTTAIVRQIEEMALDTPGVLRVPAFAGFSGSTRTQTSNAAVLFPILDEQAKRTREGRTASVILQELQNKINGIEGAFAAVIPPPAIEGIGTGGGFAMRIEDQGGKGPRRTGRRHERPRRRGAEGSRPDVGVHPVRRRHAAGVRQHRHGEGAHAGRADGEHHGDRRDVSGIGLRQRLQSSRTDLSRDRASRPPVPEGTGGPFEAADAKRRRPNGSSRQLRGLRRHHGPRPRAAVQPVSDRGDSGDTTAGMSSTAAIRVMERLAKQVLPVGFSYEWTDLSFQEVNGNKAGLYVFPLCVLFVFLVLAAQYGSWTLPLAVILIVPMCLLSATLGVRIMGQDVNVLTQIGFVVLVGLAAKNAILIVEFARDIEQQGRDRLEAVIEACRLRLRPILMTSFAFILGVLPLAISIGSGSEMRRAVGTAVFFGMLGVTLFGLLFTPVFYMLIRRIFPGSVRLNSEMRNDDEEEAAPMRAAPRAAA